MPQAVPATIEAMWGAQEERGFASDKATLP
jgi:hypothetical protein